MEQYTLNHDVKVEVTKVEPVGIAQMSYPAFLLRLHNSRSWFNRETEKDRKWWAEHDKAAQDKWAEAYFVLEELAYMIELARDAFTVNSKKE